MITTRVSHTQPPSKTRSVVLQAHDAQLHQTMQHRHCSFPPPDAHAPLQFAVDSPDVLPKRPLGHGVGEEDPAGQYDPAGHTPLHSADAKPDELPNRPTGQANGTLDPGGQNLPTGHIPLQLAFRAVTFDHVPAAHSVHELAPLPLY